MAKNKNKKLQKATDGKPFPVVSGTQKKQKQVSFKKGNDSPKKPEQKKNFQKNLSAKSDPASGVKDKKSFKAKKNKPLKVNENGAKPEAIATSPVNKNNKTKKGKDKSKDKAPPKNVKVTENGIGKVADVPTEPIKTLKKRQKNRVKAEIKKNLAMEGKSTNLADSTVLLERKLKKLLAKPEPRSVKVQRKILLIQKVLKNTQKPAKGADAQSTKKPDQPAEKKAKTNEQEGSKSGEDKKNNQFVVFIGNLRGEITKELLLDHFKAAGKIEKIKLPKPKRKSRQFAYIQLENEVARQNILNMHGTMINGKPVNVMYADKKKGKNKLQSENGKLMAQRNTAVLTEKQTIEIGKQLKNKKKKKDAKK